MNKERLKPAIDTITDYNWTPFEVFKRESDVSIQPTYITRYESILLKNIGIIVPEKFMPAIVRTWAGEEGEMEFREALNKLKTPLK